VNDRVRMFTRARLDVDDIVAFVAPIVSESEGLGEEVRHIMFRTRAAGPTGLSSSSWAMRCGAFASGARANGRSVRASSGPDRDRHGPIGVGRGLMFVAGRIASAPRTRIGTAGGQRRSWIFLTISVVLRPSRRGQMTTLPP
jgi:hypothetical protein